MKPIHWVGGIAAIVLVVLILTNGVDLNRHDCDKILLENVSQGQKTVVPLPPNRSLHIRFIHSLYGGYQTERFLVTQQQLLALQQVEFESYDALLYYTDGNHTNESREGSYWIVKSDYITENIVFIVPQVQRIFSVTVGDVVFADPTVGKPGEMIKIHVGKCP